MKTTQSYLLAALLQGAFFTLACPLVSAQETAGDYVSRKEYEELKAELLAMKKELAGLKKSRQAESSSSSESPNTQAAVAEAGKTVVPPSAPPEAALKESPLGLTNFHIAGWGSATYEARNGNVSDFTVSFNPIRGALYAHTPRRASPSAAAAAACPHVRNSTSVSLTLARATRCWRSLMPRVWAPGCVPLMNL